MHNICIPMLNNTVQSHEVVFIVLCNLKRQYFDIVELCSTVMDGVDPILPAPTDEIMVYEEQVPFDYNDSINLN